MNFYLKILILCFVLLLVLAIFVVANPSKKDNKQAVKDNNLASEKELINLLKKDDDVLAYINKYRSFRIENKNILSEEEIINKQNGQELKEVYQDINPENDRYVRVDLIDGSGSNGLIVVIDLKEQKVIKSFDIINISIGG